MIYDISFLTDFREAERITGYWQLMAFFSRFPESFWRDFNIYTECHHIYPTHETSGTVLPWTIQLPVFYHFKAHILRARESVNPQVKGYNYSSANQVAFRGRRTARRELRFLCEFFPREIQEAKQGRISPAHIAMNAHNKRLKGVSYEERYGAERAAQLRTILSTYTRERLSEEHTRRSASVKAYASHRPAKHNAAISASHKGARNPRARAVLCVTTGAVYDTILEAAKAVNVCKNAIRGCCQGKRRDVGGLRFEYNDSPPKRAVCAV